MLNFCSPPFFFASAHGVKNLILIQKQRQISFSICKPLILHTTWKWAQAKLVGKKSLLLLMLSPLHLYWDLTSFFEHCLVDWFQQCDQGHELALIPCDDNWEGTLTPVLLLISAAYICDICALSVPCITYDHLYYSPCFNCLALFDSLLASMCDIVHLAS